MLLRNLPARWASKIPSPLKRGAFWAVFSLIWLIYAVPFFQARLFPNVMDQLADMLDKASFVECIVNTDRPRPSLLILGLATASGERVTGEVYQHELTLQEDRTGSHYRAHAVNTGAGGSFYATNSQVYVSADGTHVVRVEVKACDQLVDSAEARSSNVVLQEQCAVPVREAACEARSKLTP